MLHDDARVDASCGCSNFQLVLNVRDGHLLPREGIGHFAVPAWILSSLEKPCSCSGRNNMLIAGKTSGISLAEAF